VGGKAQRPAYQQMAGHLRLAYAQFQELEEFSRFGTRLDEETRQTLRHGQRVREVLKQDQYAPIPVEEQVAVLFATAEGVFDELALDQMDAAQQAVRDAVREQLPKPCEQIRAGETLDDDDQEALLDVARRAIEPLMDASPSDANT